MCDQNTVDIFKSLETGQNTVTALGQAVDTVKMVNSPSSALTALNKLNTTLLGLGAPVQGLSQFTQTLNKLQNTISNVSGVVGQFPNNLSNLETLIQRQVNNLPQLLQTYAHYNDMRKCTDGLQNGDVGSDILSFFGSFMIPINLAETCNNLIDDLTGASDGNGGVLPNTQKNITSDNIQALYDTVSDMNDKSVTLLTQDTTEPDAFTNAMNRLSNYSSAMALAELLKVPEALPVLTIAAGAGMQPVLDNYKSGLPYYSNNVITPGTIASNDANSPDADITTVDRLGKH